MLYGNVESSAEFIWLENSSRRQVGPERMCVTGTGLIAASSVEDVRVVLRVVELARLHSISIPIMHSSMLVNILLPRLRRMPQQFHAIVVALVSALNDSNLKDLPLRAQAVEYLKAVLDIE